MIIAACIAFSGDINFHLLKSRIWKWKASKTTTCELLWKCWYFWHLRISNHDNHIDPTIKSDTGRLFPIIAMFWHFSLGLLSFLTPFIWVLFKFSVGNLHESDCHNPHSFLFLLNLFLIWQVPIISNTFKDMGQNKFKQDWDVYF